MALTPTVVVDESRCRRKMQRARTGARHHMIDILQYSLKDSLVKKDLLHQREITRHDCRNSEKCIFNQPADGISALQDSFNIASSIIASFIHVTGI